MMQDAALDLNEWLGRKGCDAGGVLMWKLLIVDDDEAVRRSLGLVAALDGWETFACDQVADVRGVIVQNGIDLVLLDYWMPPRTGMDLLREWRAAGLTVPVVMISAYVPDISLREAKDLGVHRIMLKPPDIFDLRATLRAAVKR